MDLKNLKDNEALSKEEIKEMFCETSPIIAVEFNETLWVLDENVRFIGKVDRVKCAIFADILNNSNNPIVHLIPASRREGGAITVRNDFKETQRYNLYKSYEALDRWFSAVINSILKRNDSYRLVYIGGKNFG
jgi:hypothetical protein